MDPRTRLRTAALFYALFAGAALLWNSVAGRPWLHLIWDPDRATAATLVLGLIGGAGFGAVVVLLSRWSVARASWARELYVWFAALLGPLSWADAAALAGLSAVGEEIFFRGAMQASLGLYLTSTIFGAMHPAPRLRLLPWTLSAAIMGLVFGWITEASGNLAGAVMAHFVINFFNLRHVSRFCPAEVDAGAADGLDDP